METLTGENIQTKRPVILYIIIVILLIIIIILSILLGLKYGEKEDKKEEQKEIINPINRDHFIPVTDQFYKNDIDNGAFAYHGSGNHLDSEYFKILDVYNMKPTKNRSILTHFKTYQQTSEFTSPCSLIITIMTYYGMEAPGERNCSLLFGLDPEGDCKKNTYNRTGVFQKSTIPKVAYQLNTTYHLDVISSANFSENDLPFKNESTFGNWVKNNIDEGNIILVMYNDWAGQLAAIIGIDDMGTEETNDDVLILADVYDTTDHLQDGYTIWSLEKFYALWQYTKIDFYKDDESLNHGQFIVIKNPKKE
jgi:hypothetical protein